MKPTGDQFAALQKALLSAFPSPFKLRQMVKIRLGESLNQIAGGENLAEMVFNLIEWAEAKGRVKELIIKAYEDTPGNPLLSEFARPFLEQRPEASPATPPPYTQADLEAYLQAVIRECETINLPYAQEGEATLPLVRVYVALRAKRSSPVERRASHKLFEQLVRQGSKQGAIEERVLYEMTALNPYAARYLLYDEQRAELIRAREREPTYHLAQIVSSHRWLVLLGHPGSGKSTLARWLALQLAQALLAGEDAVTVPAHHVPPLPPWQVAQVKPETLGMARLPVLLRIADYAAARWQRGIDSKLPLSRYLGRHLALLLADSARSKLIHAMLDQYLAAGRVSFILDGLDEVTELYQRQEIAAQIERLIRTHVCHDDGSSPLSAPSNREQEVIPLQEGNQLIVTSRIVGYHLRPLHENLPHFVIQPMDEMAVRRFCDNWVEAIHLQVAGEQLADAVLKHQNRYVREQMGRNPLLLTILAQVFRTNPQEGLPARRVLLYQRATQAVFKQRSEQWERLKQRMGGEDLEPALQRITAYLAFHLHANPKYPASLVPHRQAKRWLHEALKQEPALKGQRRLKDVAEELLQAAANLSGFFVARGEGVYGFLYRQFQEYFAAIWLVEEGLEGNWQPFLQRLPNPYWREVLLLAISNLVQQDEDEAADILMQILDATDPTGGILPYKQLFVAVAMREGEEWPKRLVKRVAAALIQAYHHDDKARFEVIGKRVKEAFQQLPRRNGWEDGVSEALVAALHKTGHTAHFARLAAAELIIESKWHTEAVVCALSQAWQRNVEPAGIILLALQDLYYAKRVLFRQPTKSWRSKLSPHWRTIEAYPHWQAVIKALYLVSGAEFKQEAIIRNSPLTDDLLHLLQKSPEEQTQLVAFLQARLSDDSANEITKRDAGLALIYLGESSIVPLLVDSDKNKPYQRAVIVAFVSAYVDALAFIRKLSNGLLFTLACARISSPTLANALTYAQRSALVLVHEIAIADAQASLIAIARTNALARLNVVVHRHTHILKHANLLAGRLIQSLTNIKTQAIKQKMPEKEKMVTLLTSALADTQIILQQLDSQVSLQKVWQALDKALQEKHVLPSAWLSEKRPTLDEEWLKNLTRTLQTEADSDGLLTRQRLSSLLPRLDSIALQRLSHEAKALLRSWLVADDPLIARHGALLLAELDSMTPQTLPLLCDCLEEPNDLTRYRAQQVIHRKRLASQLGCETIELMARLYTSSATECLAHSISATSLDWALKEIEHDRPEWLQRWAEAGEPIILRHVHRLSQDSWPTWLHLLTNARPVVQEALLDATSSLLELYTRLTNEQITQLLSVLMRLSKDSDSTVSLAAINVIAHLPRPNSAVIRHLLTIRAQNKALPSQSMIDEALARLAARCRDSELCDEVQATLIATSSDDKHTALVRLIVTRAIEKEYQRLESWYLPETKAKTNSVVLSQLRQWFPNDKALLGALLAAGTDNDGWGSYHQRLVALSHDVIQNCNDDLLDSLLKHLRVVLDGEEWPAKRIALATVAACAEPMADALNSTLSGEELEALLVKGTKEAGSHHSRRFAMTALSHLPIVTPSVIEALLDAARDIPIVQGDIIKAIGNFQRLSQAFDHDEALAPLIQALQGESLATAYLAAQLLAALGRSPAGLIEKLRQRIATILSDALRHPNAQCEVYLLEPWYKEPIQSKGTLAQALYAALGQVVALPE